MPGASRNTSYTAHHLQVLEGLEAVRKRPGMYIGSTDGRGLMHCLWEIIDNSVDEALAGVCSTITVTLHADGSVEVGDDGRGVPVDIEPRTGLTGVEVVYTKLHAGGKFGGGSYTASGGLHGVGASVVNALSARLDVEVDRGGKTHAMSFRRGEPGVFADQGGPRPRGPVHAIRRDAHPAHRRQGRPRPHRHPGALLGRPADLHQGRPVRRRGVALAGSPDLLPRAGAEDRHPRQPRPARHPRRRRPPRGGLPPRGRHQRVRRVPRHRPAGHRHLAAAGRRAPSPRRCRCSTPRAHDAHRGRARMRRRHRAAVGDRLRHLGRVLRQHHRHAQGRHPHRGVRPGHAQGLPQAARGQLPPPQGRHRQGRQGRHPRRPDRGRHRAPGRAAVRGADQGGARHAGGARDRRAGRRAGADRSASRTPRRARSNRAICCSRRSSPR